MFGVSRRMFVVALLFAAPVEAFAEGEESGLIDRFHYDVSRRLSDFIGQIDNFFGGEEESARSNESWARLRIDPYYEQEFGSETKANVKLKLILPRSERRFRVLLSTDEEDNKDEGNRSGSAPSSDEDSNVSFALRFIRKAKDRSGTKFDVGAKVRSGAGQGFFRWGVFLRRPLFGAQGRRAWTGTITNNARYFSKNGFEDKLTFKLQRTIGEGNDFIFLNSTQFSWFEGNKGAFVDNVSGFYKAFASGSTLALELSLNGITAPAQGEKRFREGQIRVRYRRNVLRDWFFIEFWPSVQWPVEENFTNTYGVLLRFEALVGMRDPHN